MSDSSAVPSDRTRSNDRKLNQKLCLSMRKGFFPWGWQGASVQGGQSLPLWSHPKPTSKLFLFHLLLVTLPWLGWCPEGPSNPDRSVILWSFPQELDKQQFRTLELIFFPALLIRVLTQPKFPEHSFHFLLTASITALEGFSWKRK